MEAVDNEEYEECARLRDEIKGLKRRLQQEQKSSSGSSGGPVLDEQLYSTTLAALKDQLKEAKINEEFELCIGFKKKVKVCCLPPCCYYGVTLVL